MCCTHFILNKDDKTRYFKLTLVTLIFIQATSVINVIEGQEESQHLNGIRFNTNLIEDTRVSTFLENYVTIGLDDHNDVVPTEISFCFRWQFHSMVGQCFFDETNLGIFFKKPSVSRVGYVVLYGAYVMFGVPINTKYVPLVWHHICVSYKDYQVLVIMDGKVLLNKTIQHFEKLNSTKITLKNDLMLGTI